MTHSATFDDLSFPNGAHVAEVEVDPQTGHSQVVRYVIVDDFGYLLNPMLVAGQVHGGVVQGLGQAMMEHVVYDEKRKGNSVCERESCVYPSFCYKMIMCVSQFLLHNDNVCITVSVWHPCK